MKKVGLVFVIATAVVVLGVMIGSYRHTSAQPTKLPPYGRVYPLPEPPGMTKAEAIALAKKVYKNSDKAKEITAEYGVVKDGGLHPIQGKTHWVIHLRSVPWRPTSGGTSGRAAPEELRDLFIVIDPSTKQWVYSGTE